jgi:hypothetical protein
MSPTFHSASEHRSQEIEDLTGGPANHFTTVEIDHSPLSLFVIEPSWLNDGVCDAALFSWFRHTHLQRMVT